MEERVLGGVLVGGAIIAENKLCAALADQPEHFHKDFKRSDPIG